MLSWRRTWQLREVDEDDDEAEERLIVERRELRAKAKDDFVQHRREEEKQCQATEAHFRTLWGPCEQA